MKSYFDYTKKEEKANMETRFFDLCNPCGKELYPKANFKKIGMITTSKGECPRCHTKYVILTPVNDWEYASGTGGVWD